MFRTNPSRFALLSVLVWAVLCFLSVAIVLRCWAKSVPSMEYLGPAQLALTAGLGASLWMNLPRALRWRVRRSVRPSAELQAERQRIARDLHDHVGSQMVSAMSLLDPAVPAQAQALRALEQCLLDLRWVVDSMDSAGESLPERLARLRHRIEPVLQRRGIEMVWSVDCTGDTDLPNGDECAKHLLCIAQEALSNVLQHSGATQVEVCMAHLSPEHAWQLEISDNGVGLAGESGAHGATGRGLAGMRQRARLAGGYLQLLRPPQGGTCVRVVWPGTPAARLAGVDRADSDSEAACSV